MIHINFLCDEKVLWNMKAVQSSLQEEAYKEQLHLILCTDEYLKCIKS